MKSGPKRRPVADRLWEKVNKNGPVPPHCPELGPCWIFTGYVFNGYGHIWDGGRIRQAHCISFELAGERIADGLCVLHRCDNRPCVNPGHLFSGTKKNNSEDMVGKGRQARGTKNGQAKMTDALVRELRVLRDSGRTLQDLGGIFGLSKQTVSRICRREAWFHVL